MTEVKDFSWCVCLLGCRVACLFLFVCCKSEKNTAGSGNTANNFLQISQYLFELCILYMLFFYCVMWYLLLLGLLCQAAQKKTDEEVLKHIRDLSCSCLEVRYHRSCYKNYTVEVDLARRPRHSLGS